MRQGNKKSQILALTIVFASAFLPEAGGETVYVSNEKDNTITILDGDSLEVTATVPVGLRPRGIILSHDGSELYICASDSDTVEVLDLETLEIVGTLPSGAATPSCSCSTPTGVSSTSPTRTTR